MSNIIDKIQVSGVTYDIQGSGGGGITVDPTLDSGSTNPVANSAITTALDAKVNVADNAVSTKSIMYAYDKGDTAWKYPYNQGLRINQFFVKYTQSFETSNVPAWNSPMYITNDGSTTSQINLRVNASNYQITSVASTSGDFTYALEGGQVNVTLPSGYYISSFAQKYSFQILYPKYVINGGQSAQALQNTENVLNDIYSEMPKRWITGESISCSSTNINTYVYDNNGNSNNSSIQLGTSIKGDGNTLDVYFDGQTIHQKILNTGSGNYCDVPNNVNFDYVSNLDEVTLFFNSAYTGSNTSYTIQVNVINSSYNNYTDYLYYDVANHTLDASSATHVTAATVGNDYTYSIRPKQEYFNYRIVRIRENNWCNICGIDNQWKEGYIITGVTTPSYSYQAQEIIDDIYDKIDVNTNYTWNNINYNSESTSIRYLPSDFADISGNKSKQVTSVRAYVNTATTLSSGSERNVKVYIQSWSGNIAVTTNSVTYNYTTGNTFTADSITTRTEEASGITHTYSGNVLTVTSTNPDVLIRYIRARVTSPDRAVDNSTDLLTDAETQLVVNKSIQEAYEELDGRIDGKVRTSVYTAYTAATDSVLATKQTTLTAGTGISITDNVISATGGAVSTAITSGDTNAVAGGAVYDKLDEVEQVTARALNELNDAVSGKQDTLVSGTNIKTINNTSILGSGNIDIQGGGGTVESAITSGSTNAVESKAIWSATTFNKGVLLTFNGNSQSTNYPEGCGKLVVENIRSYSTSEISFRNDGGYELGRITINNIGNISVDTSRFEGATATVDGNKVTIIYPSTGITSVRVDDTRWAYTAVVEGAWVNENTYMKLEVDAIANGLQNNINSKLDATAYTPTVVDSALNVASQNPVQNQALYSELRIDNGETETTLAFENRYSTNYPNGCTKLNVEVVGSYNNSDMNFYNDNQRLGYISIDNWGGISVNVHFDGASYEISGTTVIITYPTVTNVTKIEVDGSGNHVYKAIVANATPLIDQVAANTTALGAVESRIAEDEEVTAAALNELNDALGGLKLVKLTQTQYNNLQTKDASTLYIILG